MRAVNSCNCSASHVLAQTYAPISLTSLSPLAHLSHSLSLLILSLAASFSLFHISILNKCPASYPSLHHFSNFGSCLPFPSCGSPAIFRISSKYSSKSG